MSVNNIMKMVRMTGRNIFWAINSIFWKRDKSVILFGSWFGMKFADNPRFLYQFLYENKKRFGLEHVVWVTWNEAVYQEMLGMGYEVYLMDSQESIKYHKKAYAHIVCNSPNEYDGFKGELLGQYSYGARRINMWHGVGNKATGFLSQSALRYEEKHPTKAKILKWISKNSHIYRGLICELGGWGNCYYCGPSESAIKMLSDTNSYKRNQFIKCGYARHCTDVKLREDEKKIINQMKKYKYVILYLPTFRSGCEDINVTEVADDLYSMLKKMDVLWIQKAHTASRTEFTCKDKQTDIVNLDSNFDVNVLIPKINILITDYSSCNTDAMYFKKPVIYYIPDYESYLKGDNGFIKDPLSVMCGLQAVNLAELEQCIYEYLAYPQRCLTPEYLALREEYWEKECTIEDVWSKLSDVIYNK